jgi:hypothetical protein
MIVDTWYVSAIHQWTNNLSLTVCRFDLAAPFAAYGCRLAPDIGVARSPSAALHNKS